MSEPILVPGTLRGFRAWVPQLQKGQWWLHSITAPTRWDGGVQWAACNYGHQHKAPDPFCDCGIYAKHEPVGEASLTPRFSGVVFGTIRASGVIVMGTSGFRAERAEIEALYVPYNIWSEHLRDALRRHYTRNIHIYRWRFRRKYPPVSVSHLLADVGIAGYMGKVLETEEGRGGNNGEEFI